MEKSCNSLYKKCVPMRYIGDEGQKLFNFFWLSVEKNRILDNARVSETWDKFFDILVK